MSKKQELIVCTDVLKKYKLLALTILCFCLFYAAHDLVHFIKRIQHGITHDLFHFVHHHYLLSLILILVITLILDFDYYQKHGFKIKFSRFSTIVAAGSIAIITFIQLSY